MTSGPSRAVGPQTPGWAPALICGLPVYWNLNTSTHPPSRDPSKPCSGFQCVCSHGFRHRVLPARWAVLPTPVPYLGLSHPGPPYGRSQAGSPHHVQGHCGKNSKMGSERKTGRPLGGGGLSQDVQGLKEEDEEPGQLRSQWRAIGGPKASLQRFIWKQYGGRTQGQRIKQCLILASLTSPGKLLVCPSPETLV